MLRFWTPLGGDARSFCAVAGLLDQSSFSICGPSPASSCASREGAATNSMVADDEDVAFTSVVYDVGSNAPAGSGAVSACGG